jgi:CRP-like cAMP-binding protein
LNATELKRFSLLAEFTEEELDALLDLMEERSISRGVALFREGSEGEGLVLIVSGEARVTSRRIPEDFEVGEGDSLGALSLIVVGTRETTAVAEQPCKFLLLPRTAFHRLAEDMPRVACRLAEAIVLEMAGALREGLDELASGAQHPAGAVDRPGCGH